MLALKRIEAKKTQIAPTRVTLAQQIWGLDWGAHFPWNVPNTLLRVELGDPESARRFYAQHFEKIYETELAGSPFVFDNPSPAKNAFQDLACDFFHIHDGDELVGIVVCSLQDWSTYYLRNGSILPAYQNQGILQAFFNHLFQVLGGHGVERAEIETSPANLRLQHVLAKMEFNPTGYGVSERWGTLIRMTKFLSSRHERAFLDSFCLGVKPQLKRD